MTAAVLTPRVRIMTLCDGIRESKTEVGVFNLKGVRQDLRAYEFPFVPERLWLFLVFASSRDGEFPGYVRIVNDRTDRTVYYSYIRPRPSFHHDGDTCTGRASVRCTFPEEGRYTIQIWFFREEGLDVLKGEMPFDIFAERTEA